MTVATVISDVHFFVRWKMLEEMLKMIVLMWTLQKLYAAGHLNKLFPAEEAMVPHPQSLHLSFRRSN
jgi:hypothetical protein